MIFLLKFLLKRASKSSFFCFGVCSGAVTIQLSRVSGIHTEPFPACKGMVNLPVLHCAVDTFLAEWTLVPVHLFAVLRFQARLWRARFFLAGGLCGGSINFLCLHTFEMFGCHEKAQKSKQRNKIARLHQPPLLTQFHTDMNLQCPGVGSRGRSPLVHN